MKPPISLLDKRFQWTPSHKTQIRDLFDRVRAEQEAQRKKESVDTAAVLSIFAARRNGETK